MLYVLFCGSAWGKEVKTVNLSENQIYQVKLALGKTTLLRFDEKPQKIIIGNKNYFNVENTGQDVALQPLGRITTNMFVYTEKQTFSFDLLACENCHSDDFLIIRKKTENSPAFNPVAIESFREASVRCEIRLKSISIVFRRVKTKRDVILLDFEVTGSEKIPIASKLILIDVLAKGKSLKDFDFAFEKTKISKEKIKGRIVIYENPKSEISIIVKYLKQHGRTRIERNKL